MLLVIALVLAPLVVWGLPPPLSTPASRIWASGYVGTGIRVAVLDTGIECVRTCHFSSPPSTTNWTPEPYLEDHHGHGTTVASIIAGTNPGCVGFAPNATLYSLKVVTHNGTARTPWLMQALDHVLRLRPHIINLSHGSSIYDDAALNAKFREVMARGIVVVAATGNSHTHTILHPANLWGVIGAGASIPGGKMADFSSYTTQQNYQGVSLVDLGKGFLAAGRDGMCEPVRGGTSFAAPRVTGALALLLSVLPASMHFDVNLARSLLVSRKLSGIPVEQQGIGELDLDASFRRALSLIIKGVDEDAAVLPKCGACCVTKEVNLRVVFSYATCCGYMLCGGCLARGLPPVCPQCHAARKLYAHHFLADDFETQLTKREAELREQVHRREAAVCGELARKVEEARIARKGVDEALGAYNDLLEKMADEVHATVWGDYPAVWPPLPQQRKKPPPPPRPAPSPSPPPPPSPLAAVQPMQPREARAPLPRALPAPVRVPRSASMEWQSKAYCKMAGGFKAEWDKQRSAEAALDGLFFGI